MTESDSRVETNIPRLPSTALPMWYPALLHSVAEHIATGHGRAVRAANSELVLTYWSIGREILERQQHQGWGAKVIDRLSADLKDRFPGATGYSPRNLKYMRAFAVAWPDRAIVQGSLAQLPWYHQIALLDKLDTADLREWYAQAAIQAGWSRDLLAHQIASALHKRSGRAVTNFARTVAPADSDLAQQTTKDPYLFDFLTTDRTVRERDLERGLVEHVSRFLLELGQGFAFVGRQLRLELGDQDFYCDLLFYHLKLRCYVVIELKAGAFEPGFLGQLGVYMAAIDDLMANPDDKPTIGLLLCRTKNNVVAEYALRGWNSPIGVAEWTTALNDSLPQAIASSLPTTAELESELSAVSFADDSTQGNT